MSRLLSRIASEIIIFSELQFNISTSVTYGLLRKSINGDECMYSTPGDVISIVQKMPASEELYHRIVDSPPKTLLLGGMELGFQMALNVMPKGLGDAFIDYYCGLRIIKVRSLGV